MRSVEINIDKVPESYFSCVGLLQILTRLVVHSAMKCCMLC